MDECLALADLGASINLMHIRVEESFSPKLTPTCMTLKLADCSISQPIGIAEDVSVKTGRALIDVYKGELTLRVGKEAVTFNLDQTLRYSSNYDDNSVNRIDVIDMACEEYSQEDSQFKTLSLDELRSPDFNLLSDQEYSEEEVAKTMAETMEQYMSKTRDDYGSGVARPKIEDKDNFELKGQFLKELCTNTFSGSDHEDANEHIEKVLEIVDLFHIPNITIDQVMLRAFPMSLTRSASRWLRNKPTGLITTWDGLKIKFLNKYCPLARIAKKMKEINNIVQSLGVLGTLLPHPPPREEEKSLTLLYLYHVLPWFH
ncbi:hypothetical protein Tco_1376264 [Tanacetum coccineum]